MKKSRILILFLAAALFALAGCGGGGSGGGVVNQDPDGDGIVTAEDAFPNDANRFAAFESFVDDEVGTAFSVMVGAAENSIIGVGQSDLGGVTLRAQRVTFDTTNFDPALDDLLPLLEQTLSPIAGNTYSATYGVNTSGLAVGESSSGLNFVPVYWSGDVVTLEVAPTPLPLTQTEVIIIPPEGEGEPTEETIVTTFTSGAAYGVNASGQIVGEIMREDGSMMAVLWQPDAAEPSGYAEPVTLSSLTEAGAATAHFINDAGLIVGEAMSLAGMRATLWTVSALGVEEGSAIELDMLNLHVASSAYGIDADGRIVGESETATGIVHGVLWRSAADAAESLGANTSAMAINSINNRIVGSALVGDEMRAAIWDTRSTNLTNTDAVLSTGAPAFTPLAGSSRAYAMSQGEFNVTVGLFEDKAFVAVPVLP